MRRDDSFIVKLMLIVPLCTVLVAPQVFVPRCEGAAGLGQAVDCCACCETIAPSGLAGADGDPENLVTAGTTFPEQEGGGPVDCNGCPASCCAMKASVVFTESSCFVAATQTGTSLLHSDSLPQLASFEGVFHPPCS